MATTISKWIVILNILAIATRPGILIKGQEVPCFFLFGDSQFDNGNNNGLNTQAKVNYPPYGIDYPGAVPTGRFTNGQNVPDFLGTFICLQSQPFKLIYEKNLSSFNLD